MHNNQEYKVSVVIPLFNKAQYIARTLKSVLNQSFQHFEVIIVDDGSTDNSLDILSKFKDSRIKIITQVNQGVSVARNTGIENAKTNWIAFLDADDCWDKTFLEKIFTLTNVFPDGKIFATGRKLQFPTFVKIYSSPLLPKFKTAGSIDYFKVISNTQPPINSSSCLISRELLLQSKGFIPGMKKFEDHELWIRIALHNSIYYYNEPLSVYHKDVDELHSGSKNALKLEDFFLYLQTLLDIRYAIADKKRLGYLQLYSFKFFLYNYLNTCTAYSILERNKLLKAIKGLVSRKQFLVLMLVVRSSPKLLKLGLRSFRNIKSIKS